MKTVCSTHQQAYDVGERCPYCPAGESGELILSVPSWTASFGSFVPLSATAANPIQQAFGAAQMGQGLGQMVGLGQQQAYGQGLGMQYPDGCPFCKGPR